MADYAHPEVLVTSEWLAQHLTDPGLRIIEVDVDTSAYEQGISGRGRLELADPTLRSSTPRHPDQRTVRTLDE